MNADPMPAIRSILGFPADANDETVIENRDMLTVARLNLSHAETTADTDEYESLLAFARTAAIIAQATEQRLHNRLAYIALFPDTPTARRLRDEIEEAL